MPRKRHAPRDDPAAHLIKCLRQRFHADDLCATCGGQRGLHYAVLDHPFTLDREMSHDTQDHSGHDDGGR